MLYKICLSQILIYLFIIPAVRLIWGGVSSEYSYWTGLVFLLAFISGGVSVFGRISTRRLINHKIKADGKFIIIIWALSYVVMSVSYGLFNRRIGTHEAAELFASIPIYALLVFRSFEVMLPFLLSLFVVQVFERRWQSSIDKIVVAILILAIGFSGAIYSRGQIFYLLASVIVILQNSIDEVIFKRLLLRATALTSFFVIGVSIYRWLSFEADEAYGVYFSREFLARLDGLEVISYLTAREGVSWFGLNPSAIFSPLISAIPFLPEASELKATAMTSVKANILYHEFGSSQGDINSFVLLDSYYWGGILGLVGAGFVLGYASRCVDRYIGKTTMRGVAALLVAAAGNVVFMEREFISMLINVVRDWLIVYVFMVFFLRGNSRTLTSLVGNRKGA